MTVLPVNLIALTAIVLGSLMFLIPIAGWTARFAIRPITEAIAKMNAGGVDRQSLQLLERRLALLEQETHAVAELRSELQRLTAELDFQRQLGQPKG